MGCNQEKKKKEKKKLLDFPLQKKSRLNCANTIGLNLSYVYVRVVMIVCRKKL